MKLKPARARALLRRMRGQRVVVIGDVMLDVFLWGHAARLSPEAPVPVVEILRESLHLGGAANVAANVRSLGGHGVAVGVVGDDAWGAQLREALAAQGIEDALVADVTRPTTVKTRIVAQHQQVVRADRESGATVSRAVEADLRAAVRGALRNRSVTVVSDYQKGVVTRTLLRGLVRDAVKTEGVVLVDPKVPHFPFYRRVSLVTPNQPEAEQATGIRIRSEKDLLRAGERILRLLACDAALITRGENGMALFERGAAPLQLPTMAREVFDVTGAGDTVIATVALALAAGATRAEAALLANFAAGVVVGKLGTATASPAEVLAAVEQAAH